MATSRSTVVRRPHGIPGADKQKAIREQRKVISLNGPVQPRKSLTIEQQQPDSTHTSTASITLASPAEEVTQPATSTVTTIASESASSIITLVSRKDTPRASEHEEADEPYQDEPDTDSLLGDGAEEDYEDEEEEQTQVYEQRTQRAANTRTIPTTERRSYQDEEAQHRTNSYVVPRKTYTQQQPPPTPTSRTRETGGNYRPSNDPNKTRVLPRQQHQAHPLLFTGLGMAVLIILWFATTSGASWFTTYLTDPATYGPMHGSVAIGIFGGGDSDTHPSQLIAMNSNGQVEILKLTAGDPKKAQIIVGPNLVALGFTHPENAEVALTVRGDTVTVTIYGDTFPFPLHRFNQALMYKSDGRGNLKPVSPLPAQ